VRLQITHLTRLSYSESISEEVMECRFGPFSDADQRWERFELRVKPSAAIRGWTDAFHNPAYLVTLVPPHETIELTTRSEVVTLLADPFAVPAVGPPPLTAMERFDYLSPSRLVLADPRLADLAEPHRPQRPEDTFAAATALADLIHQDFIYERNATTPSTTVAEVLDGRKGVCQDFAHVLIGLCRAVGIPARYVSGYVTSDLAPDADSDGAPLSASHAWAEVYTPTPGWRGFDPANNLVAAEHHVKVATGRDYGDVPPTRGTFRGAAAQTLTVEVAIEPR
jgi:transglutaminase-like putative cysteine protease